MSEEYRIVPGWLSNFTLERKRRFLFWRYWSFVTCHNDWRVLVAVVKKSGFTLLNSPHPSESEKVK